MKRRLLATVGGGGAEKGRKDDLAGDRPLSFENKNRIRPGPNRQVKGHGVKIGLKSEENEGNSSAREVKCPRRRRRNEKVKPEPKKKADRTGGFKARGPYWELRKEKSKFAMDNRGAKTRGGAAPPPGKGDHTQGTGTVLGGGERPEGGSADGR